MKNITRIMIGLSSAVVVIFTASCFSMTPTDLTTPATQIISLTPNQVITPTVANIPEDRIQMSEKCVEIIPPPNTMPNGIVVLQDEVTRSIALFDVKTHQKSLFDEAEFIMAISPDSKQLAYTDKKAGQIIILSSNGENLSTISVPDDWIGVVRWVTSNTLLIEKFIETPFKLASTVMYDIKTGDIQELSSDFPRISKSIPPLRWGNYSYTRTVYDPSFSRVIYPAGDEHGLPLLILWNLETNREVVEFRQGYDDHIGGAPQWTRDGLSFMAGIYPQQQDGNTLYKNVPDNLPYKGGFELFHVSRDGKIQRLTYFTTNYQAGEEGFSLSPDEKHIAFWLNLNYKPGDLNADRKLAVLDITTGEITNLCLAGGATPTPPIWSPDGKYLVVSRYYITGDTLSDAILIDLEHSQAIKIADNAIAKGWLAK